jgi:hypothetical protein
LLSKKLRKFCEYAPWLGNISAFNFERILGSSSFTMHNILTQFNIMLLPSKATQVINQKDALL